MLWQVNLNALPTLGQSDRLKSQKESPLLRLQAYVFSATIVQTEFFLSSSPFITAKQPAEIVERQTGYRPPWVFDIAMIDESA